MEHWGLDIAVLGPIFILAHVIVSTALLIYKKRQNVGTWALLVALLVAMIAACFAVIAFLIYESLSIGSVLFTGLFFLVPQFIAYIRFNNTRTYLRDLLLSIGVGLLFFVILGSMFGKGNID